MKVTVVPAQVTTIEDKIAGNLGPSQLALLAAPVFGGSVLYMLLPPMLHDAIYKLVTIGLLFLACGLLAIRIKGKIVLLWLVTLLRYNLRPRFYVYDKRSLRGRENSHDDPVAELEDEPVATTHKVRKALSLSTAEVAELERLIENPAANLSFTASKKGKLYVRITEVRQES